MKRLSDYLGKNALVRSREHFCWRLTAVLAAQLGWRGTCFTHAAVQIAPLFCRSRIATTYPMTSANQEPGIDNAVEQLLVPQVNIY